MAGTNDAKRELRRVMRAVRREVALDRELSAEIVDRLDAMPAIRDAQTVMLFDPVPGEPDLRSLGDRLRARGATVLVPVASPDAPRPTGLDAVDVVIVPGLAFTRAGARLGQGGGWYDRLLATIPSSVVVVGVCFDEQLLADVPIEEHDVLVRWVVTPSLIVRVDGERSQTAET